MTDDLSFVRDARFPNAQIPNAPIPNDPTAPGRALLPDELALVAGGLGSYERSLTTAVSFVGLAAATATAAPVVAGAFAIGSLAASGLAIFTALTDDERKTSQ
ncbi:MAG: hypothetical protein AAGI15_15765 [Pseudomonadota bacterium]